MTEFNKATITAITAAGTASGREETAKLNRDAAIAAAAKALHDAKVKPQHITKGGAHYEAVFNAFAKGRLTAKEFGILNDPDAKKRITVKGKVKYLPKHGIADKVNKSYARFAKEAGKAIDKLAKGATVDDVVQAAEAKKSTTASKNARGRNKPLPEALEAGFADMIRRTNSDKVRPEPSGKAHAEVSAILRKAMKDVLALQK